MPNNNKPINESQQPKSTGREIFSAKSKDAHVIKANPNPNFIPPATKSNKKKGDE